MRSHIRSHMQPQTYSYELETSRLIAIVLNTEQLADVLQCYRHLIAFLLCHPFIKRCVLFLCQGYTFVDRLWLFNMLRLRAYKGGLVQLVCDLFDLKQ